ncbi:MAG: hypothetical protein KIS94_05735 [Chitinophagales bacterium]|nr:hypothetical protein [Chitinophagales bacterium]
MRKVFTLIPVLMFLYQGYATIHYQYYNQYVGNTTTASKDIDADGTADFKFSPYNGLTTVICLKPSSYYAANVSGFPIAYTKGAALGTMQWVSDTGTLRNTNNSTGQFGNNQLYMMIKFSNGANVFYGWVLLSAGSSGMVIVGHGYNDVPNEPITPGQESATTGISELKPSDFSIIKINEHQIAFGDCDAYDRVVFYDLQGKLVADIVSPIAQQCYTVTFDGKVMLVAFYRNEQLIYTTKRL